MNEQHKPAPQGEQGRDFLREVSEIVMGWRNEGTNGHYKMLRDIEELITNAAPQAPQPSDQRRANPVEIASKPEPQPVGAAPNTLYIWLVPSEQVFEQPGSWRIRKWDTESFPEANFVARSESTASPWVPVGERLPEARTLPGDVLRRIWEDYAAKLEAFNQHERGLAEASKKVAAQNPEQHHSGRVAESPSPRQEPSDAGVATGRAPVVPDYDYEQGDDEGDESYRLRIVGRAGHLERELAAVIEKKVSEIERDGR